MNVRIYLTMGKGGSGVGRVEVTLYIRAESPSQVDEVEEALVSKGFKREYRSA